MKILPLWFEWFAMDWGVEGLDEAGGLAAASL
jgi:hypothetical protein